MKLFDIFKGETTQDEWYETMLSKSGSTGRVWRHSKNKIGTESPTTTQSKPSTKTDNWYKSKING